MTTAARKALGTLLQYGDAASPEKFLTVAEVTEIEPPSQEAAELDATSHDSTDEEFILSFLNNGSIGGTCNYLHTASQTGATAKLGGAASNWQICIPNFGARTAAFTVDHTSDIFTSAGHGLTTGQPIQATTTEALPDGMAANTTYYVRKIDTDTFTLHTTNAGAVGNSAQLTVTDNGTGIHTLQIGTRISLAALFRARQFLTPLKEKLQMKFTLKVTGPVSVT